MQAFRAKIRNLTTAALLTAPAFAAPACDSAFETPDPTVSLPAPLGAWCAPVPAPGLVPTRDAAQLPVVFERQVGQALLTATWTYGASEVHVERAIDGAIYETQRWTFGPADPGASSPRLIERSVARDPALAARVTDALDDLAVPLSDDGSRALPTEREARGATCLRLPSSFGHGYPVAEGWYRPGAADPDAAEPAPSPLAWYGHEGDGSGLAEGTLAVTVRYDARGRMIAEDLEREEGLHDLERRRTFDGETLIEDRLERFSPTPKEDTVRVLRFALTDPTSASPRLRRDLLDTWETLLERRYLSGTAPR